MPKRTFRIIGKLDCWWSVDIEADSKEQAIKLLDDDDCPPIDYSNDYDSSVVVEVEEI